MFADAGVMRDSTGEARGHAPHRNKEGLMKHAEKYALVAMVAGMALRAVAADSPVAEQDLVNLKSAAPVTAANWSRQSDSYMLRVVLDSARPSRKAETVSTDQQQAAPAREQESTVQAPVSVDAALGMGADTSRSSFFIGNTIANLRGLDPAFHCGRTLTLVDGRRVSSSGAPPPPNPAVNQAYPPKIKERRVEVWLLGADGTQILPTGYSCISERPYRLSEVQYLFSIADSEQAVAAAIRIDSGFYIEKLSPLAAKPPTQ